MDAHQGLFDALPLGATVLNPAHAMFKQIKIGRLQRFPFDGRLAR